MTDIKPENLSTLSDENKTRLTTYIDDVLAKKDSESFSAYAKDVAKNIIAGFKKPESVKESLTNSRIKLVGNDVLVDGKKVGSINNDHAKEDAKIKFSNSEGNKSFNTLNDLYKHLIDAHNLQEKK